jgi:hypothetical protein
VSTPAIIIIALSVINIGVVLILSRRVRAMEKRQEK